MIRYKNKNNNGYSILELILIMIIISAASVAMFKFFGKSDISAKVQKEQDFVSKTVDDIFNAYRSSSNFQTVNGPTVAGLFNIPMVDGSNIKSQNFGSVLIRPATHIVENDSFEFVYNNMDRSNCSLLVKSLANKATSIVINSNNNVLAQNGALNDSYINHCAAEQSEIVFRFTGDKSNFNPTQLENCLCSPDMERRNSACPEGQAGQLVEQRIASCTGGTGECRTQVWSSWTPVLNSCISNVNNAPANPNIVVPQPLGCVETVERKVDACQNGSNGAIISQRIFNCATNDWRDWQELENSCSPAVNLNCSTTPQRQTFACPSGMGGQILKERASICSSTGVQTWGEWRTVNDSCTAACVAGQNCCQVTAEFEDRIEFCGVGNYGKIENRVTRSTTCSSATSTPVWSNTWNIVETKGSCTSCPAAATEERLRSVESSAACPSGQTGSHTWISEQKQSRNVSYNCNAFNLETLPSRNETPWSDWVEYGRTNEVNSCAATTGGEEDDTCTTFEGARECIKPEVELLNSVATLGGTYGSSGGTRNVYNDFTGHTSGDLKQYQVAFRDVELPSVRDCRVNPTNRDNWAQTPEVLANFSGSLKFNNVVQNFKLSCSNGGHLSSCNIVRNDLPGRRRGEYVPSAVNRSGKYESDGSSLIWSTNGKEMNVQATATINAWATCDVNTGKYFGHANMTIDFELAPYYGWCGGTAAKLKPTCYHWTQDDVTYGPGSGCKIEAYPYIGTNGVNYTPWRMEIGKSFDTVGYNQWNNRNSSFGNITVNETWYPCNKDSLGDTVMVLSSCGGWQAGMEGYSFYKCD